VAGLPGVARRSTPDRDEHQRERCGRDGQAQLHGKPQSEQIRLSNPNTGMRKTTRTPQKWRATSKFTAVSRRKVYKMPTVTLLA